MTHRYAPEVHPLYGEVLGCCGSYEAWGHDSGCPDHPPAPEKPERDCPLEVIPRGENVYYAPVGAQGQRGPFCPRCLRPTVYHADTDQWRHASEES